MMKAIKLCLLCLMGGCLSLTAGVCSAADRAAQARTLYQQEEYEEVSELLSKADSEGSLTAIEAYYLGLSQKQAGLPGVAITSLKKALTLQNAVNEGVIDLLYLLNGEGLNDEMATWIAWAEERHIKPAEIAYLKGLLLSKQGDAKSAINEFSKAKMADPAFSQRADMQIALLQVTQHDLAAAKLSLEAVISSDPSSELAGFARDYNLKIEQSRAAQKKWSLLAGVAYQWDDNVAARPVKEAPGIAFPKKTDSAINEYIQLIYNTRSSGPWQLSAHYSLYNNNYFKLREYNQLSNTLGVVPAYTGNSAVFSLPLTFNYTHLDYTGYSNQISVKPTVTLVFTPTQLGQISGGYARRTLFGTAPVPAENRDAHLLSALVGYYYLFADNRGMFNLRYEFLYEGADGSNWRNNGNRLAADLLLPLADTTSLILSADVTFKEYLGNPTPPNTKRRDLVYSAGVTLKQQIYEGLFLNVQYFHNTTDSTAALYDYTRNVYVAGIEFRL